MRFGPVPLDQAEGALLAHSLPLQGGGRLGKGKRLDREDLTALRAAGLVQVTVARLEPGDVDEDAAALALARALVPDPEAAGLVLQPVGTGRVNLLARGPGVAFVAAERVHAVNAADPAITLATVPEWQRMEAGGMVATVKIIAYGVHRVAVERACKAGQGALAMRAPVMARAALIETLVGQPGTRSDKGRRVMAARLERLGVVLAEPLRVAHDEAALAEALAGADAAAGLIMVLTGSATSDIRDVAPQALRRAGGRVDHFGMPVDPGNLLFIGALAGRPVVGLPGCARSPVLNGADWVVERLLCGVPVGAQAIRRMGVGGLLKESPARPRPRRQAE